MSYFNTSVTDDQLLEWSKTLRDDKKFLYAVADMLDSVFSKAAADHIISNAPPNPPLAEYAAVMKYLQKLGGFKYQA